MSEKGEDDLAEFAPFVGTRLGSINVFHINGDEVEQALAHLGSRLPLQGYNIIYPAWELAIYPRVLVRQLERFDEVWAPSAFIGEGLSRAGIARVHHMPLSCEVILTSMKGRRYFNIPESAYAFLFFFDFRSYAARKNPEAVVKAFAKLVAKRPDADVCLVVKVNGAQQYPLQVQKVREALAPLDGRFILIEDTVSDNEVKNLVRCCDCFVSLHRAEGFGRGLSEAQFLGKPVIATGYSGNLDFTTPENALLVDFRLVPVLEGEYPHWENQVWADPDIEQAAAYMIRLVDKPEFGRALGRRASSEIRAQLSYRAVGNRYRERLEEISAGTSLDC
jgi:glycosyltransferase involved in cell wall biosynthesis